MSTTTAGAQIRMSNTAKGRELLIAIIGLILGAAIMFVSIDIPEPNGIPPVVNTIPALKPIDDTLNVNLYPVTDEECAYEEGTNMLIKGMELEKSYSLKRHYYDEDGNVMTEHSITTASGAELCVWQTPGYPSNCDITVKNHKEAIPWIKWLRQQGIEYDLLPPNNKMDTYRIMPHTIIPGWVDNYIEVPTYFPSLQ